MQHTATNALSVAQDYHRRNWQPLPVDHAEKNPNRAGWEQFKTTFEELTRYFNGAKQNIGVLLGTPSNNLIDIDLDAPETLKLVNYFLPKTTTFGRVGNPRSHWLYQCSIETEKFVDPLRVASKDKAERKNAMIIEIRSTGAQTIFPGSTHPSGEKIEWFEFGEPTQIDAKELRRSVALIASATLLVRFWREGARHEIALALSGALLRNGWTEEETAHFIKAICHAANDEDLEDRIAAVRTTNQRLKNGNLAKGFPSLIELTDEKIVKKICSWLEIEASRHTFEPETQKAAASQVEDFELEMPEPLPNELLPVPEFDGMLLPDAIRGFCVDTSERMQSPIEFVSCAAIVAAASLIGNRIRIAPKRFDDWIVTPNLWAALVATPGKLKTPALQAGLDPLKKRELLALKDHTEELKRFEFDKIEREAQREAVKGKLKEAAKKGEATARFRDEFELLTEIKTPTVKSYIVNDATIEKLGVLLNQNPRGVLLFRDELIGFLRMLDKEENANAKAFMLECWNGYGSYVFDRIGRGETRIENLTLSILGGIQPGVLASYLRGAIAGGQYDDGFIQRFQLAFYPDAPKWHLVDRTPNNAALSLAHECYARLDNLTADREETLILRFNEDAQDFFYQWWTQLEESLESGEFEHPALIAHFSKYRSLMPSLALIFHLFDVVAESIRINEESRVSLDAAMKAAAWCALLGEHARRIYGIAIRQETTQAKTILQKIQQGKLKSPFTAREVWRNQWTGLHSSEECQKPLQLLVDYGYLFPTQISTTNKGGRPTVSYFAHPFLISDEEGE